MVSRLDSEGTKECKSKDAGKSDRCRQKLSNEYFVLFFFDTTESESSEVCQKVVKELDRLS